MEFIDTHCHIHEPDYKLPEKEARERAAAAGVDTIICVGTDVTTSSQAVMYASDKPTVWASIGLHPHDAKLGNDAFTALAQLLPNKNIVAIGECGLDYFYNHSDKKDQFAALENQMQLAQDNTLPMIFHVREAFDDFWPIYDNFSRLKGVVHSFTDTTTQLDKALNRDLYIGLNGIMTFTKDQKQLAAAKAVPLERLLLETDAPFLTPKPLRGKINEPKNVSITAEFLAQLRGEELSTLAAATTKNARQLFGLPKHES
ncbi:MAG TPA: TatD family hydrolase [Candidatus Saccharibacteria bacterium]|nr:TatD family hydrolase [Candidatus Nomurabacteria bacterium]HPR10374.1 TatD family hydrolase [Candidatus Saccharibacteria bacterium]